MMRFLFLLAVLFAPAIALADEVLLMVDVGRNGAVTARVDLTAAVQRCNKTPANPASIVALTTEGQTVPFQFVPDADFDATSRIAGTVVLRLPNPAPARMRLRFGPGIEKPGVWNGVVTTPHFAVTHDPRRMGGFPWKIAFPASGKVFETPRWNNRVHHRELGSFCACDDPQATVELVSDGPLCSVVRVRARYVQGGKQPASEPSAVYDWYYFRDQPLVFVTAAIQQKQPFTWHEVHFLEMDYSRENFPRWAGGEPLQQGEFKVTNKTHSCPQWGVVHDGRAGIGMFACGQVLFYDAGPGTYIQAHGDSAWRPWSDTRAQHSAWLWLGTSDDPARAVQSAAQSLPASVRAIVSTEQVRAKIEAAAKEQTPSGWQILAAEKLESEGRLEQAVQAAAGRRPPGWISFHRGGLSVIFERTKEGIRLFDLVDTVSGQRLTAAKPSPFFSILLRNAETKEEVRLAADSGWSKTEAASSADGLRWEAPLDKRLGDLRVVVRPILDSSPHGIGWKIAVEGQRSPWALWRVVFPAVAVPDLGAGGCVFFPKGAGEVQRGVWQRPFRFTGTYPSGWTTMQFMAAYREDLKSGLSLAIHDPYGGTKDLLCESRPEDRAVVLAYDHPAPDMGVPGNRFELSGQAVLQLLQGDWFDAAVAYRDWVRREAKWYPKLAADGRPDTPLWMRELSAWSLGGGRPQDCVGAMKGFAQFLGIPTGFHWYNWHQIPFDNDYPHYFPTHPGFADGVRELQSANVSVMPYINGRLWDTRDKGKDDFEFTKVALPAVSKNEQGEPYTETYGSKESDGSPVRLGAMCPSTELWQNKVRQIVLRLMNECGVKGVYIDQVAAAAPTLCFDKSHGHPLGGGHWWTEGYWKLLDAIRREMPKDRMLTTECNGEPYIRCFDGYLTWHWQYDGQVPAFPAVYGGAIQMFGRSYGGGETKNLALRMRAGQQLVFGEQIGWINPAMAMEKDNAEFFKSVVLLRHHLRRYFHAGEMARPPKLAGQIPTVRADWQWGGTAWVATDAVLTGAWRRPAEKRLALIFVNVGDQPLSARIAYDAKPYGFQGGELKLTKITPQGPGESGPTPPVLEREAAFPPRSAWAWELQAE